MGEKGHKRNAVLMNAGAALYIGGKVESMAEGINLAAELIDSGKALCNIKAADRSQQPAGGRGMTILDQLAEHAGERVSEAKRKISPKDLKQQALSMQKAALLLKNALRKDGISFICECKKASPSKGLIAPEFPYLQIAEEYEAPVQTAFPC